jgi:hypothetical protein
MFRWFQKKKLPLFGIKINTTGEVIFQFEDFDSVVTTQMLDCPFAMFFIIDKITTPTGRIMKFVDNGDFTCDIYDKTGKINTKSVATDCMRIYGMECSYEIFGFLHKRKNSKIESNDNEKI